MANNLGISKYLNLGKYQILDHPIELEYENSDLNCESCNYSLIFYE